MMIYNGDKIENHEIQYYYDSIFQKLTNRINGFHFHNDDSLYWANAMFQKFKIQFYSVMQLTYKMTRNPNNQYEYLDIASINSIIRSCFETFLIFEYIYTQPSSAHEKKLRLLLYQYHGYKDARRMIDKKSEQYKEYSEVCNDLKTSILNMSCFSTLPEKKRSDLLFDSWKPSWNQIVAGTKFSTLMGKDEYGKMSWHVHNTFAALNNVDYYYRHLDEYDFDAINLQLYMVASHFIQSMLLQFEITIDLFSEDELGIISEFLLLSTKESMEH
ncbi:hypothetical protein FHS18_004057 [Paenibacillus phyllosphaerae]|uniref:Uncharacterized protein n=1 Tax=Paenibacillus phyllosphaerae TaxID=274593 RepID=A0A7W5FPF9_9BACL|nr:hypothetical protein [Paenibacillus phyllosphaerae]MBB3111989.1 hypothetical protein [Paenibacillus phyllosphaerae]